MKNLKIREYCEYVIEKLVIKSDYREGIYLARMYGLKNELNQLKIDRDKELKLIKNYYKNNVRNRGK